MAGLYGAFGAGFLHLSGLTSFDDATASYMRYVPTDKLTGQERVIFEDLKKDIGS
jgi:hypothetical protein